MADTKISALTAGTLEATDRIPVAISPFGAGDNRYLTPVSIKDYILGLANTFTRGQTVTQGTANEAILASTGYSLTGSSAVSLIDLAGTWNTTGAPTALKLNITNTASDAASLLADLQVGATSQWKVSKAGAVTQLGTLTLPAGANTLASMHFAGDVHTGIFSRSDNRVTITANAFNVAEFAGGGAESLSLSNLTQLSWASGEAGVTGGDVGFLRAAAGIVKVTDASTGGGALQFLEQTAPAGTANAARIYAQDNGAGKTQLMVIFGSGAAQQIAIEP